MLLSAPITFNTALPVAKGEFLFRQQIVSNQSSDDPGTTNRDRNEFSTVSAIGYGINSRWSLFGILPYRNIKLEVNSGAQRIKRRNKGLGDLTVFARYSAYQKNQRGKTMRVAPFLGLKLATGRDNNYDNNGRLPQTAQTSSGSTDVFGGIVFTYQTLKIQYDAQISYRVNNKANNFKAGNVLRLDGSVQYRLWHSKHEGLPHYLYGVAEMNVISQAKNKVSGNTDPNSNGTRLYFSPGIQYVTKRWILEGGVQIPVNQDLNGTALENDYIVRAGLRFNF